MKKIITTILLLLSYMSFAQTIAIDKIEAIVSSKIAANDPGLFVGVVKDGAIVYEYYNGLTSLQHQVKADETSRSNIASVAKQFTALCVLKLNLEGSLNLEDDIRTYLPNLYKNIKEPIKVRHLINHTSGIRDYSDLMSLQTDPWWSRRGLDNDDVIELLEKQEDLNFIPGSEYTYSNSNYTILTKIVEKVSGVSFHDYSKQLFESLGMKNTTFLKNYMVVIPNQALPYSDWGDGNWQQFPMLTNLYGDGFLFTTLKDQLIYEQAVQNAQKTTNQLLIQSQLPIPNSEITTYGFGLELEDRLNYKAVHHAGGTGSYNAQMARYPEEGLSIFVMSSNNKVWSSGIADQIANVILPKKESNIAKTDFESLALGTPLSLKAFTGTYTTTDGGIIIKIFEEDGKVKYKRGNNNSFTLVKEKDNLYAFEESADAKIALTQTSGQPISLTLYLPEAAPRFHTKIPNTRLNNYELDAYTGHYENSELDVAFEILKKENTLYIQQQGEEDVNLLTILTPTNLLVSNYKLKVERDAFNRVREILISLNRIKNVKFIKKTSLEFQPVIPTDNGSIQVTTIASKGDGSNILLTKNYENGNEIWSQQFGGKSYDKANSIIDTKDGGYLLVGSTSSFGNGNYDVYVIKVDDTGKEQWTATYGDFYNEYGNIAEETENGYIIKGTKQECKSNNLALEDNCKTNVWVITIDKKGNQLSDTIQEEIIENPDYQKEWHK
ncbi:serine hydrolase domain-containing protein [uncultured Dokdonia sp.]|uniref:serine hydrolase domain-containing protein n=1 Tax=uncultured Dokdonia sp. TaxID=575653 RepID=UPI002619A628|nr:serine hydrolase domain-containing protein [uncultured Dokdonia sp.]